jgi:cytochrome c biogenesis factor
MIGEIGHFALVLALAAAVSQTVIPFWGARMKLNERLTKLRSSPPDNCVEGLAKIL